MFSLGIVIIGTALQAHLPAAFAGVPGGGWGSGVIPFMGLESESDLHTYIPYIVIMQSN